MKKRVKMKIKDTLYPEFSLKLIEKLMDDFPDKLPDKQVSDFELGKLIGQQNIIKKLRFEYDKFETADSSFEE